MTRPIGRWLRPLAVASVAMALAGCADSEQDRYVKDYDPLNDRLLEIGQSLGRAQLQAGSASNSQLGRQFSKSAAELDAVREDIAALDTPADLADESKALIASIGDVVGDLERISAAATRGDQQAAAAATLSLTEDSNDVNRAQNRLARATGANVGPR